jgi:hypothetical protein
MNLTERLTVFGRGHWQNLHGLFGQALGGGRATSAHAARPADPQTPFGR